MEAARDGDSAAMRIIIEQGWGVAESCIKIEQRNVVVSYTLDDVRKLVAELQASEDDPILPAVARAGVFSVPGTSGASQAIERRDGE